MTSSRSTMFVAALLLGSLAAMLLLLGLYPGLYPASSGFAGFQLPQIVVQTIETLLPETAIMLHPVGNGLEWSGLEPAGPPLGFAAARNQACPLEHLKVFRNGGHTHRERFSQLSDGCSTRCQARQDGPAG